MTRADGREEVEGRGDVSAGATTKTRKQGLSGLKVVAFKSIWVDQHGRTVRETCESTNR
jgi:hypothetical protein